MANWLHVHFDTPRYILLKHHSCLLLCIDMAINTRVSSSFPLHETIVHNNTIPRIIELVLLSLLVSLLVYRVVSFTDQEHQLPWLIASLCESWFTFNWFIIVCIKWNQQIIKTYPERIFHRTSEMELPSVDVFVTTADPGLEPPAITVNTVLSLLAVDYPAHKLALYVSDDGCSPLTFYSLVEAIKFAKLWVPFCKKYNIQVRAPFRYFTTNSLPSENISVEFQQEWKIMKNEYGELCKKMEIAAERPLTCDSASEFAVFSDVQPSNHPAIIKVISENKEGIPSDLPHVVYISREKRPKHHHHYKAGAMNVLARVSGLMTNAPLMLNVDCDMYANNPQVVLHAMCMLLSFENEEDCGFVQFPQIFYDGFKDDPFGNQLMNLHYIALGVSAIQGPFYAGSNCFHRRKAIYGLSPNEIIKTENLGNEDVEKIFGKSIELKESAAQLLSGLNTKIENRRSPSSFIEAANQVAGCSYESGTGWGTKVGWMYGSTTEDVLTGLGIHGRGWRSKLCLPETPAFLGCSAPSWPCSLIQQKRWAMGIFEIIFTHKNPLILAIKGKLWFRQCLAYLWINLWAMRSVPELCYALLPAYCIITNSHFFPKINEPVMILPMGIFVIYNLYGIWEFLRLGLSIRMWWNIQKMGRVNTMTAWFFGFVSVILKLLGLSQIIFEVTPKKQSTNDNNHVDFDANAGYPLTFDKSNVIVPGVAVLLVNLSALVNGVARLQKVNSNGNGTGIGEIICSVWVTLCFWDFLKGLFGKGKYGIPFSIIWKSGAFALLFLHLCRRSSFLNE